MAQKKIITLEKLAVYEEKNKARIQSGDANALAEAKKYADGLATNYDAAGNATTAEVNAKTYTDTEIEKVNGSVEAVEKKAQQGISDAAIADEKAVKVQGDVDTLKTYVGTIPEGNEATDVIGYINKKTEGIATDTALAQLQADVDGTKDKINAIDKDYLKSADKTELEGKITTVQGGAAEAKAHSEGVASDLATAKAELGKADTAQVERIAALEGKIAGLTGAMHFKGTEEKLPDDVSSYTEGDVIIVGEKEYVFNGTEFKEFGDVSAEGQRIKTLEDKVQTAESDITQAKNDIKANSDAIAKKVEQTTFDGKVASLEDKDDALDTRLKTVEGAIGTSGSVATDIANAKSEAISVAAEDATTKANEALEDAKTYTNEEVEKDRKRLATLEAASETHALKTDLTALTNRVTTAEGKIDTLQTDVDAVETLASTNKTAIEKLQAESATKTALQSETDRATSAEAALGARIDDFVEASEIEINALFN